MSGLLLCPNTASTLNPRNTEFPPQNPSKAQPTRIMRRYETHQLPGHSSMREPTSFSDEMPMRSTALRDLPFQRPAKFIPIQGFGF